MTHTPPVPAASTSPYPLHPPAHAAGEEPAVAGDEKAHATARQDGSRTAMKVGAAVGIGSAAIVAALLYVRSGGGKRK